MNFPNTSNPFELIYSKLEDLTSSIKKLTETKKEHETKEEDFLDLNGAAQVLHMPTSSIHFHKKYNNLPFKKAGKRLLFVREHLIAWASDSDKQKPKSAIDQMSRIPRRVKN